MIYSYTSISMWHKCPSMFDFRYNKKIKQAKSAAAARGTDTHSKIEDFLVGKNEMPPDVAFGLHIINDMKQRGFQAERQFTVNEKWEPVPYGDGALITSFVDSCLEEPDRVSMGEWKTGKVYDNHAEQRDIYLTMALSSTLVEEASIHTIYLDAGKVTKETMVRENLEAAQAQWMDKLEPVRADSFYSPRPGQHCKWCSYARSKLGPCAHG